ncbi:MAG: hypothetical protein KKB37_15335 [Alphaproteobacteria bacterium]|nr:hypothetical protein [Alphaproteobacteria bacterium]
MTDATKYPVVKQPPKDPIDRSRRDFFKLAPVASIAILPIGAVPLPKFEPRPRKNPSQRDPVYAETELIARYYSRARF